MRIKCDVVKREIAGETYLVPIGVSAQKHPGLFMVNDLGAFIWDRISEIESEKQLVECIMNEYEVDENTASSDVSEFITQLKAFGIVE